MSPYHLSFYLYLLRLYQICIFPLFESTFVFFFLCFCWVGYFSAHFAFCFYLSSCEKNNHPIVTLRHLEFQIRSRSLVLLYLFTTFIWLHVYICLPNPTTQAGGDKGQYLSGVLRVWIQRFLSPRPVAIPKLKSLVCPTICTKLKWDSCESPFRRVLVLHEVQMAESRNWTQVTVSISHVYSDCIKSVHFMVCPLISFDVIYFFFSLSSNFYQKDPHTHTHTHTHTYIYIYIYIYIYKSLYIP